MPYPKVDSLKQPNMESGFQAHEQDMEIGYEDKPSTLTFEGLEQRFLDEIMKLAKEAQGENNTNKYTVLGETYQQAGLNHHHPTNASPIDPCDGYGGAVATEAHQAYATGQSESYRDRTPFLGGGRNQGTDARVPIPEGRVYNNTNARCY
ncbi:hypothetical protein ACSBR2_007144 [Camellia fascicularis]